MSIYVAYNGWGDLIAEAFSYDSIVRRVESMGYSVDEVTIGKVTP